ncbi:MAG TPA: PP2C family protein-serine/threonine phosphatase [Thermoanaerobaculia bacterium]|nr:PP2C family protein-serine/threonine phosphatase [Thermoanaerobaculia bacterium]
MLRLSGLTETFTIEQLAAMTDEEMVRRRFDAGNVRYMTALTMLAFVTAIFQVFIGAFSRSAAAYQLPIAILHLVVAGAAAASMGEMVRAGGRVARRSRLPVELIARNLTPWILGFLVVEYALLTVFRQRGSHAWLVWAFIFPWFLIAVRMEFSRRLTLHASLIAVSAINALASVANHAQQLPEYVTAVMISAATLFIGAASSRRLRRQTIDEWSERRTQARDQVRMREELQYAREVQLSMLPEMSPAIGWVELAGASLPATEVGGDYYDYFVEDGSVAIVCGDVAGHGLASAIVLASLRSGFMLLRDSLNDPASVLQRLNDLVAQTSRRRMLATVAVLRLDASSRRATIASAGHPPLFIRRNGAIQTVELFAPPLGVRLPFRVPSADVAFASGDVFVMHSDGVYESRNAAGETYGLGRLSDVLSRVGDATAAAIRDAIIRDVEAFRAGSPQDDDVTVVVARVS